VVPVVARYDHEIAVVPVPIVVGLGSLVWTPILGEIHIRALLQLGVADPRGETAVDPPTETPNAQT
jgi:hypothetical protein